MTDPLDWRGVIWPASNTGTLLRVLATLPRERWMECDPEFALTLLHYACFDDNLDAVVALLKHGLDPNARSDPTRSTPLHSAAQGLPHTVEVLCHAGADLRALTRDGTSPLEEALSSEMPEAHQCALVLMAHGVRLSTVRPSYRGYITPQLEALERGVLRCRAVVVTLLGLKRRRGQVVLPLLDRFVVRELARACWVTCVNKAWQLALP